MTENTITEYDAYPCGRSYSVRGIATYNNGARVAVGPASRDGAYACDGFEGTYYVVKFNNGGASLSRDAGGEIACYIMATRLTAA